MIGWTKRKYAEGKKSKLCAIQWWWTQSKILYFMVCNFLLRILIEKMLKKYQKKKNLRKVAFYPFYQTWKWSERYKRKKKLRLIRKTDEKMKITKCTKTAKVREMGRVKEWFANFVSYSRLWIFRRKFVRRSNRVCLLNDEMHMLLQLVKCMRRKEIRSKRSNQMKKKNAHIRIKDIHCWLHFFLIFSVFLSACSEMIAAFNLDVSTWSAPEQWRFGFVQLFMECST